MLKKGIGFIALWLVLFCLGVPVSSAHSNNSLAYSDISIENGVIKYILQIDMYDLRAATAPNDPDIALSTPEVLDRFVKSSQAEVAAYMFAGIQLYADNLPLQGKLTQLTHLVKENQPFAEAVLEFPVRAIPQHFVMDYNLVFESDQWHVNYVTINFGELKQNAVIVNDIRELQAGGMSLQHAVKPFFLFGLVYLLTDYQAILFILGLLIGVKSLKQILVVIGTFAGVHSLTLILSTLQIMTLPVKFIEIALVLSVVYVVLNNLFNRTKQQNIWLIVIFSLIHGFGFAKALTGIKTDGGYYAFSIAAFNVGIEVSLVLIVLISSPIIHYLSNLKRQTE